MTKQTSDRSPPLVICWAALTPSNRHMDYERGNSFRKEANMNALLMRLLVVMLVTCAMGFLTSGVALASECTWCDQMANSLTFYKATYPTSNFDPYLQKVGILREAVGRGDQNAVRAEIQELFTMLRSRAHGINDVAADEILNHWQMVTPMEQLNLSEPLVEECTSTPTRLTCGNFSIERVPDPGTKTNRHESQDNMGGAEGG